MQNIWIGNGKIQFFLLFIDMKYVITEKQLANLIIKRDISDDLEYEKVSDANPESDEYVVGNEVDEQNTEPSISTAGSSTTDTSGGGEYGDSPSAEDYPPYPETGKWQSGIERGPANQVAMNSKWSDVVGSKLSRGHANPLK